MGLVILELWKCKYRVTPKVMQMRISKIAKNKTSVCTGTHGGSETSFNAVVNENVKVYT